MCGIWAYINKQKLSAKYLGKLYQYYNEITPRGPERSKLINLHLLNDLNVMLGFHRLSIIDTSHKGDQPFVIHIEEENRTIYTLCNGEIYNYKQLISIYNLDQRLEQESDCKVIPEIYLRHGIEETCKNLIGEFAFIILDIKDDHITLHVARDPLGVRPLYISYDNESINFSSELKGIVHTDPTNTTDYKVDQVKGGTFTSIKLTDINLSKFIPTWNTFYNVDSFNTIYKEKDLEYCKKIINKTFTQCVIDRLNSDVPIGFLLSGGLDSSLVCAIAAKYFKDYNIKIKTFSCGLETGSTDEPYARMVSEYIGSEHTHVVFKVQEFLDVIPTIVYNIETYDITTVRASVGQYLISKWVRENTNIKVLLIGDGSDELTKGYKYNHKAPNPQVAQEDTKRLLRDIIYFDGQRADRGIASNGLEARLPFLDRRFISLYLSIEPKLTMPIDGIEKWLLRESFKDSNILPNEVLYRSKEAFSDGVSSLKKSWYQTVQDEMNERFKYVSMEDIANTYPFNTPPSKEALFYRMEFERLFNKNSVNVIPYFWLPKWVGDIKEPSARVLDIYNSTA
jgi:asparagine synthase (glutamine-hydrolysing)